MNFALSDADDLAPAPIAPPPWGPYLGHVSCVAAPTAPVECSRPAVTRPSLTERERQAVERAAAGATNKEVAYDLHIAHATVRVLMHRAARKLGARRRSELLNAYRELVRA
jgi:DNA-binding CsgD family transcriptional regulator